MATELQTAANGRNATLSTGPKTKNGKARSSKNALRHGLRSDLPVLPGERAEDWQAHRDGILQSLAPSDGIESALAERVALSLWRLHRVTSYETAITAIGIDEVEDDTRREAEDASANLGANKSPAFLLAEAEKQLEDARKQLADQDGADRLLAQLPKLPDHAPVNGEEAGGVLQQLTETATYHYDDTDLPDPGDDDWLIELGVPWDEVRDAYEWGGWRAGMVRRAWEQVAEAARVSPEKLLARAVEDCRQSATDLRERVRRLVKNVKDLRRRLRKQEGRQRQLRVVLDDATLNKVMRYESHLSRQMLQALHTLERLQAARAGQSVSPPAVLDLTVDAAPQTADRLLTTSDSAHGG
jgi:hypothetical protein